MKSLKLKFSEDKEIQVGLHWLSKLLHKDWSGIHRLLKIASFAIIAVFFLSLSFLGIEGVSVETTLFYSLLLVVASLLTIGVAYFVLTGVRQFRDVAQLMLVLIYAFVAISTYLMVPASQENTFGVIGLIYASGLAVIAFLGLFYLTAINLDTQRKLSWLVKSLILGVALSAITVLFVDISSWNIAFARVFVLMLPTLLLSLTLQGGKLWKILLAFLTTVGLFSIVIYASWHVWLIAILTSLVISLSIYVQKYQGVKGLITEVRTSIWKLYRRKLKLVDATPKLYMPALLLGLLISVAGLIISVHNAGINLNSIVDAHIGDLERLTTSQGINDVMFGEGADFNEVITLSSTILTIYSFQGLLGVFAYTLLAAGGIILAIKNIGKAVNSDSTSKVNNFVLSGILISIPLLGVVFRLSFLEVLIWWSVFTLVAASNNISSWTPKYKIWRQLKVFRRDFSRFVPWIQLILLAVIVLGWYFLVKQLQFLLHSGLI